LAGASLRCRLADDNADGSFVTFMVRTQMCLAEEDYEAAREEAQRLGISLAELFRRSFRAMLPVDEKKPWMGYAGMVETGDAEPGGRIDGIAYGRTD